MRAKRLRRHKVLRRSPFARFTKKSSVGGGRRTLEQMAHGELEQILDHEVSLHVRASAAVELGLGGLVPCYTCGTMYVWKALEAGHYIGRSNRGVRWDLRNIRPQCTKCNSYQEGKHWQFRKNLVVELGEKEVEDLEQVAGMWSEYHHGKPWLIEQIKDWREKNKKLRRML
jgi:hypothetical protein